MSISSPSRKTPTQTFPSLSKPRRSTGSYSNRHEVIPRAFSGPAKTIECQTGYMANPSSFRPERDCSLIGSCRERAVGTSQMASIAASAVSIGQVRTLRKEKGKVIREVPMAVITVCQLQPGRLQTSCRAGFQQAYRQYRLRYSCQRERRRSEPYN